MEQRTKGITAMMMIARDVDVHVAETRMEDKEVEDWYIELNEDAIASGILEYEGGNEERHPKPKAFDPRLRRRDVPQTRRDAHRALYLRSTCGAPPGKRLRGTPTVLARISTASE
jgi:hypothetical protein